MADFIDKITIKDPTGGSDKDYPIGADSLNVKYKSTSVYDELNDLNTNKVNKTQTGGIDDELISVAEKNKLAGIEDGAQVNPSNLVTYDATTGKIDASYLPSYVDDVLEYASITDFPATGEDGKIYITKDTNKTYRWSGTIYVEISESLALGRTSSTAFPGDAGKAIEDKIPSNASSSNQLATKADIPTVAYPVNSVNGKTGVVTLNNTDVGAAATSHTHTKSQITDFPSSMPASDVYAWAKASTKPSYTASEVGAIATSARGAVNGVASLGSDGKVPASQLPSSSNGSPIKIATYDISAQGGSESDVRQLIINLGNFLRNIEYPIVGGEFVHKGKILHIEIRNYMSDFTNHSNSSVYWYNNSNPNSYYDYLSNVDYIMTRAEYTRKNEDRNLINPYCLNWEYYMPLEYFGNDKLLYPIYINMTLPFFIQYADGRERSGDIDAIYANKNFIEFKYFVCQGKSSGEYINRTTGNYISYKDFVNTNCYQTFVVYYIDLPNS